MAWGKTNIGGGGSSLNKSVIVITAPTGSTVTASMGGKTKRAKEENGTWTFTGLDFGEWTITATLLDKKRVITVPIDHLTVEYRTIFYNVWLYKRGDLCTDISGGWQKANGSIYFQPEYIQVGTDHGTGSAVMTKSAINLSKYNRLSAKIGKVDSCGSYCAMYVASGFSRDQIYNTPIPNVSVKQNSIVSVDITSIQSALKVILKATADNNYYQVEEVWLE